MNDQRPAWILVVDDDAVNRRLLSSLLEQDGHRVDTASDGRQALERLTATAPGPTHAPFKPLLMRA
jgi:CheY-like chemotaxis protein